MGGYCGDVGARLDAWQVVECGVGEDGVCDVCVGVWVGAYECAGEVGVNTYLSMTYGIAAFAAGYERLSDLMIDFSLLGIRASTTTITCPQRRLLNNRPFHTLLPKTIPNLRLPLPFLFLSFFLQ